MGRVVVIGGGWAGCAAAYGAAKAGASTVLLERTDMLLGTGLVGGIMRNNGRFSAAEETIALGGEEFYTIIDSVTRHRFVEFPGHRHAFLYDVTRIEPFIRTCLKEAGVTVMLNSRVSDVHISANIIRWVTVNKKNIYGDAFVDCTGTFGPVSNCLKFNASCAMCVMRCPTFGPRVSVAGKAGMEEISIPENLAVSGSCELEKASLGKWLVDRLEKTGVCILPVPRYLDDQDKLRIKACQQYATREFAENLVLLDTGHVKMMTPYFPLEKLRIIPGFENVSYRDPYSGGRGNSVRYVVATPRENTLRVRGVRNLFCAGEKIGFVVGHTEAIATGLLAGNNAVRLVVNSRLLELPTSLCIGDLVAYVGHKLQTKTGLIGKYTFSGSEYFDRMKRLGLYTTDVNKLHNRVRQEGLYRIFLQKVT
jgi:hypothetical protein